mmetsp:Transcript_6640/g.18127  ORF Transcript_6640/g.18127 Transcript_6640/m.18127 type:complete len:216 (+) Transcript_6640:287-934(+)
MCLAQADRASGNLLSWIWLLRTGNCTPPRRCNQASRKHSKTRDCIPKWATSFAGMGKRLQVVQALLVTGRGIEHLREGELHRAFWLDRDHEIPLAGPWRTRGLYHLPRRKVSDDYPGVDALEDWQALLCPQRRPGPLGLHLRPRLCHCRRPPSACGKAWLSWGGPRWRWDTSVWRTMPHDQCRSVRTTLTGTCRARGHVDMVRVGHHASEATARS